ncbi:hypothetical protein V6N13_065821 [Hibiscus sabdariffa]
MLSVKTPATLIGFGTNSHRSFESFIFLQLVNQWCPQHHPLTNLITQIFPESALKFQIPLPTWHLQFAVMNNLQRIRVASLMAITVWIPQSCNGGGSSCGGNRQMCGPYIQQQLYDGLSTGFLPEELPVYPIINGALINPVPLKYFRQFPDHVATGFVYLTSTTASSYLSSSLTGAQHTPSPFPSQFTCNSAEDVCWLFEDGESRKHGPHSLAQLYSLHCSGYLGDSIMIYHANDRFHPTNLLSVLNAWKSGQFVVENEQESSVNFISSISEEVSFDLHSRIMKAARRVMLDEIITSIISEFIAAKKI